MHHVGVDVVAAAVLPAGEPADVEVAAGTQHPHSFRQVQLDIKQNIKYQMSDVRYQISDI